MSALRQFEDFVDYGGTVVPPAVTPYMTDGSDFIELEVGLSIEMFLESHSAATVPGSGTAVAHVAPFNFESRGAVAFVGGAALVQVVAPFDFECGSAVTFGGGATLVHVTAPDFENRVALMLGRGPKMPGAAGSGFESGNALARSNAATPAPWAEAWHSGALADRLVGVCSFPILTGASGTTLTAASMGGWAFAPIPSPRDDRIDQLLDKYALLEDGWLDDRSKAPGHVAVNRARTLYLSAKEGRYPPIRCYVSGDGEVGLVWERGGGYGNVGFWEDGSLVYYVCSVDGSQEIRDDIFLGDQESLPAELIKALRAFYAAA